MSEATYRLLREEYELEERGSIEVKGKGPMRTWFLKGRRSGRSAHDPSRP